MPAPLPVEIIAHRGASGDAPENTAAAVREAWRQNADAVEMDVHLSRDGRIVVIHDATTERTTGVNGTVAAMTAAELCALDAGIGKGDRFAGERIPLLEDLLPLTPPGKRLYIEVKTGPEIVPALARVIGRCPLARDQVRFISFGPEPLRGLKERFPECEVFWLRAYDPSLAAREALPALIGDCCREGFDGVDLHHAWPLDARWMRRLREAGRKVISWTVDDPLIARRLVELGVDGITTNRPDWLAGKLRRPHSPFPTC